MSFEGVVQNGVVVPDDPAALPEEGTRVRVEPAPATVPATPRPPAPAEGPKSAGEANLPADRPKTFAEAFARFRGAAHGLPEDLAAQHEHYRLGVPKR